MEADPSLFTCERFRCTMRKAVCIERQTEQIRTIGGLKTKHMECENCVHGKTIREEVGMEAEKATKKKCSRCRLEKPAEAFGPDPRNSDGLRSWCKTCMNTYSRKWYAARNADKPKPAPEIRNPPKPPARKRRAREKPLAQQQAPDLNLLIDLHGYEEVMAALVEQARLHIRTTAGQALYYVVAGIKRDTGNANASPHPQS